MFGDANIVADYTAVDATIYQSTGLIKIHSKKKSLNIQNKSNNRKTRAYLTVNFLSSVVSALYGENIE